MKEKVFMFYVLPALMTAFAPLSAEAAQIIFNNGDRLSGTLLVEQEEAYVVKTEAMGTITIQKSHVETVIREEGDSALSAPAREEADRESEAEVEKIWSGEIGAGFDRRRGNTDTTELTGNLRLHRKIDREDRKNEFNLEANTYYSEESRKMNSRKHRGMVRYAFSFGRSLKWYNFYKMEADHDRFSNIDYRLLPSTGIGYWFFDTDDTQLMAEAGIGLSHTEYRDEKDAETEGVLIPRLFFKRRLFGETTVSEDFTVYPSLTRTGEFRLRSETILDNPITDHFSLRFTLLDEYNSDPGADVDKNDIRILTALIYTF